MNKEPLVIPLPHPSVCGIDQDTRLSSETLYICSRTSDKKLLTFSIRQVTNQEEYEISILKIKRTHKKLSKIEGADKQ